MGGGITRLRNNAFTLIELLAIIVILAIIAVITVPIILNIIENSRKGAATDSAYGYKDSVNKYYISELQNHNKLKLDGKYTVNSNGSLTPAEDNIFGFGDENVTSFPVQVSGTVPSSGELTYENNVLKSGYLVIGDYRVTFNQGGTVTTVKNSGSSSNQQSNSQSGTQQETGIPLAIGTSVNYVTSLNGITLDDWKVFLSDENYTYLIYGDYLPNDAVINIFYPEGTYNINVDSETREDFISLMTTTSNWSDLINNGLINENALSTEVKSNANVWAMGSPTIDLWVNSWNTKYPSDTIYIRYIDTEDIDNENFFATGYAIGSSENPTRLIFDLENKTGYSNTLYIPHPGTEGFESCYGYWLASASSCEDGVYSVGYSGYVDGSPYNGSSAADYSIRPVIKLPTSVVNQ